MGRILQGTLSQGQLIALGLTKRIFISDNDVHNGDFWKIKCVTDTVFNVLTDSDLLDSDSDDPTATTHPAGLEIEGHFTSIDLTSGAIYAYQIDWD